MKVIFCKFTNFFHLTQNFPARCGDSLYGPLQKRPQLQQGREQNRADHPEITAKAQSHEHKKPASQHPLSRFQGDLKPRQPDRRPEPHIQTDLQSLAPPPAAEQPEEIIEQPQQQPLGQTEQQALALLGHRCPHQPSRRAKKPPFSRGAS